MECSRAEVAGMKHTIYEDPITHKFALIRVPATFEEGDKLPIPPTVHWLDTLEEAIAALPTLLDEDEDGP
jgi:hypothetical protein